MPTEAVVISNFSDIFTCTNLLSASLKCAKGDKGDKRTDRQTDRRMNEHHRVMSLCVGQKNCSFFGHTNKRIHSGMLLTWQLQCPVRCASLGRQWSDLESRDHHHQSPAHWRGRPHLEPQTPASLLDWKEDEQQRLRMRISQQESFHKPPKGSNM